MAAEMPILPVRDFSIKMKGQWSMCMIAADRLLNELMYSNPLVHYRMFPRIGIYLTMAWGQYLRNQEESASEE